MTKLINGSIVVYSLIMIGMAVQSFFFPHEGHKPSVVSLIAGSGIGLFMLGSLLLWTQQPRNGRILSLVIAVFAAGRPVMKVFKPGEEFYPNGVILTLSVILIIILGLGHMMAKKEKSA